MVPKSNDPMILPIVKIVVVKPIDAMVNVNCIFRKRGMAKVSMPLFIDMMGSMINSNVVLFFLHSLMSILCMSCLMFVCLM